MKIITPDPPLIIAHPSLSKAHAMNHASDMLRCVQVAADEFGESLDGPARKKMLCILHQIEMISAMVDHSLSV
jgi:hypothetical protein